ncbi:hypothetical protein FSP39_010422, partial [Pinctada imbricata]
FPLPSNTDELNAFDSEVFEENVRTIDVQLKQKPHRTKSIPNLAVLKSRFQRLQIPSPSKPKFLDKLFSNVGLSKRTPKRHKNGLIVPITRIPCDVDEEGEESGQAIEHNIETEDIHEVFSDPEPDLSPEEEFKQAFNEAWSTPNSPKVSGIVKQRLLDFQKLSQGCRCRSQSTPSSPRLVKRNSLRVRQRLCDQVEGDSTVALQGSSFSRDENFRKRVMSKGYVKALVEQIDKNYDNSDDDNQHNVSVDIPSNVKNEEKEKMILEEHNVKPSVVAKQERERHSPTPPPNFTKKSSVILDSKTSKEIQATSAKNSKGKENLPSTEKVEADKKELNEKQQIDSNISTSFPAEDKHENRIQENSETHDTKDETCEVTSNVYDNISLQTTNASHTSSADVSEGPIYGNVSGTLSTRTSNGLTTDGESGIASETSTLGITAAELFDSSWSDSEHSFEEFSDYDSDNKEDECDKLETGAEECKLKKICTELLYTEKSYVKRLHLLDVIFRQRILDENEKEKFFSVDVVKQMFSNITTIHNFHRDFLLPVIEKRMENWETESKIGDLMKTNAPFLKMYSEYVKNFDHSMDLINLWMDKSSKFSHLIKEIQSSPECGCLTLQHHMLEPIQRVPRYEMLLKDYIKHLDDDSADLNDAKAALEMVTQAAQHSNEAMKKIEKFQKLLQIKEKLDTRIDLISPTRELVMEGKVKKISARGKERQDRYIFLFNDLLLICCEHLLGSYKVKTEIEMDGLEIMERTDKCVKWIVEGENMDIPNTFYVKSRQKIIQLLDETPSGESGHWCETIKGVIKEFRRRKKSRVGDQPPTQESLNEISETELGTVAPRWIKDDEVTMCMSCGCHFTRIKRRHHCRACGKVICGRCSSKKAPLVYDSNQPNRVCDKCYKILKQDKPEERGSVKDKSVGPKARKILQKKANEPSVLSGYLQKSTDRGKTWCRRWFVVSKEFALYEFKAHQDICALSTLPLPGYDVNKNMENMDCVLSLYHQQKRDEVVLFKAETPESKDRWADVLSKVAQLQLPDEDPNNRNSTQSSSSSNGENSNSCDQQNPDNSNTIADAQS